LTELERFKLGIPEFGIAGFGREKMIAEYANEDQW
jgi:hypothetical protein